MLYIIYISVDDNINSDTYYFNTNMKYGNNVDKEYFLLDLDEYRKREVDEIDRMVDTFKEKVDEVRSIEDVDKMNREKKRKLNENIKKNILNKLFRNTLLKQRDKKKNRYYINSYYWDYEHRTTSRRPWFIKMLETMKRRQNIARNVKENIENKLSNYVIIRVHVKLSLLHENATWRDRLRSFKHSFKLDCEYHRRQYRLKNKQIQTRKKMKKEKKKK